jgi:hypothetical protein
MPSRSRHWTCAGQRPVGCIRSTGSSFTSPRPQPETGGGRGGSPELPDAAEPGVGHRRAILSHHRRAFPDIREDPQYRLEGPQKAAATVSVLAVPMLLDSKPSG